MVKKTKSAKSLFTRNNSTNNFKITPRDIDIIRSVFSLRFLSSEQITAITGGSRQGISRRLNLLFHNGWLDRPKLQLLLPTRKLGKTNRPLLYALGNKGAEFLSAEMGQPINSIKWTNKNNRLSDGFFMEHSLLIAEIMVAIQLACRKVKGASRIPI